LAHGETLEHPQPDAEATFRARYDTAALAQARRASTPAFDGAAMFMAAHRAIGHLKAGGPAC